MIRVFPRKTTMTPMDDKVYFTGPPLNDLDDQDVWVSTLFTADKPRAELLAQLWRDRGYDVKVGGAAYGDRGGDFVPGRFVKQGAVMTSRGCNNKCWFCYVWKREGDIRELPIMDGYNVLDSNLLQCSDDHIKLVFEMLARQPKKAEFTGGLEAKMLKKWQCDHLAELKPAKMFFAYDTPNDWAPLFNAVQLLKASGLGVERHRVFCYVLIGYKKDTMQNALTRLESVKALGICPFAMLYEDNMPDRPDWRRFQKAWARPAIIFKKDRTEGSLFDES